MGALIVGEEGIYYCENCSRNAIVKHDLDENTDIRPALAEDSHGTHVKVDISSKAHIRNRK